MKGPIRREIAFAGPLRVREAEDGQKSRTIEGYALLFGVRSRMLCDWYDAYYEQLEPGCVTREVLDACDIKMTMFHNREKILARSKMGVGTLTYEVDDKGVLFRFDAPNSPLGDEAIEAVSRGDLAGCSFIYSTSEDTRKGCVSYEKSGEKDQWGNDILLRRVHRIEAVYDFTLAADPAYTETSVTRREVEEAGVSLPGAAPSGRTEDAWRRQVAEMRAERDRMVKL